MQKAFTDDPIRAQVTGKFYEPSGEIAAGKFGHVSMEWKNFSAIIKEGETTATVDGAIVRYPSKQHFE